MAEHGFQRVMSLSDLPPGVEPSKLTGQMDDDDHPPGVTIRSQPRPLVSSLSVSSWQLNQVNRARRVASPRAVLSPRSEGEGTGEMMLLGDDDDLDAGENEEDLWLRLLRDAVSEDRVVVQNPLFGKRNPLSKRTRGASSMVEIVAGRTEVVYKNPLYDPSNNWNPSKKRFRTEDDLVVVKNPLMKEAHPTALMVLEGQYAKEIKRKKLAGSDLSLSDSGDEVMRGLMTDVEDFTEAESDFERPYRMREPDQEQQVFRARRYTQIIRSSENDSSEDRDTPSGPSGAEDGSRLALERSDQLVPEPFYYRSKRSNRILGKPRNRLGSYDFEDATTPPGERRRASFAAVPSEATASTPEMRRPGTPELSSKKTGVKRRKTALGSLLRRKKKTPNALRTTSSESSVIKGQFQESYRSTSSDAICLLDDDTVSDSSCATTVSVATLVPRYMLAFPGVLCVDDLEEPSDVEWSSYRFWLYSVVKDTRPTPTEVTLQMRIFLHFYRLRVPTSEIVASKVTTKEKWRLKGRRNVHRSGFLQLPVIDGDMKWWAKPNAVRDVKMPRSKGSYQLVCHFRQTIPKPLAHQKKEQVKLTKKAFLGELKCGSDWALMDGDVVYRNTLINHALRWIKGDSKTKCPLQFRLLAAQQIASITFPKERVPGMVHAVISSKSFPALLQWGREGEIQLYKDIEMADVIPGHLLARGAVGKVYDGIWEQQNVVIKFCMEGGPAFDLSEFRFEVSLMSMLRSEYVLPCYGANMIGPNYFLIAPLKANGCFEEVLTKGVELEEAVRVVIARHVALGMELLHTNKVVHRDIKSANVLLDENWNACISDFNTSRVLGSHDPRPLESLVGSTPYMAPEMFEEGKLYTEKVDVYSYGILLWELVHQKHCWTTTKSWDIPDLVMEGKRPEIAKECNSVAKELISLCWHHNPRKRPDFSTILKKLPTSFGM